MKYLLGTMVIGGLLIGCSLPGEAPVSDWTLQQSSIDNGLNFNSIVFNQRAFSGLSSRPLALGRNSQGQLVFNSIEGIELSPTGRELLRYVAECALGPQDVLLVEAAGIEYAFSGLFAVAPAWAYRDITLTEKELVSACLLAHVNAYGIAVHISVRAPGTILADGPELASHPVYEGTFFGDLFGAELEAYACTGSLRDIAIQHSPDRLLRSCADLTPDCQLTVVGRCRDVCDTYSDKYGWQGCQANGRRFAETVSVFLRDDNADHLNATCGVGQDCQFRAVAGDAIFDCADADTCITGCLDHSYCTVEGNSAARNVALSRSSSMAEINCQMTGECSALCASDSVCEIDCWNADSCDQNVCMDGAECLLDCTGARDCGFAFCGGGETTCANDVVVCNRPCP